MVNQSDLLSDLLTVQEAVKITRLSRSKVYLLLDAGELPHVSIGRTRRIPRAALMDFMQRHLVGRYGRFRNRAGRIATPRHSFIRPAAVGQRNRKGNSEMMRETKMAMREAFRLLINARQQLDPVAQQKAIAALSELGVMVEAQPLPRGALQKSIDTAQAVALFDDQINAVENRDRAARGNAIRELSDLAGAKVSIRPV